MVISKQVISVHYTLADKSGKTIDSSRGGNPLIFLEGAGQIIPGLEASLILLKTGDKKEIEIPYSQAYGAFDEALVYQDPREKFPKDIKVGDIFQVNHGDSHQVITVMDVSDELVTVDGNHPLAGQDLFFSVEVMDMRAATQEEIEHGHIHDPHGHTHDE